VLLALPIGILVGLSLGALGGGGSILTVPALVYLLGASPHGATTMSLIIVGITSVVGAAAHLRSGRVRVRAGITFGVLGAGGAFAGSRLSASIHPDILLTTFAVLMAAAAVMMLRRRGAASGPAPQPAAAPRPVAPEDPVSPARASGGTAVRPVPALTPPREQTRPASPVRVVLAASAVGLVTGFFGVGGGFVVVPALVLALGFDMPAAVGTSLLVIAVNSASSLLSRLGTHAAADPGLVVTFTAAAIAGTLAGSLIASKVRPERLVGTFALLMIAVAVYTAARSIPGLV
jgi:uncharacterized membrane protein YfcA